MLEVGYFVSATRKVTETHVNTVNDYCISHIVNIFHEAQRDTAHHLFSIPSASHEMFLNKDIGKIVPWSNLGDEARKKICPPFTYFR